MNAARRFLSLALSLIVLVASGCGDGAEETQTQEAKSTPPNTREVSARANANCRYFLRETRKLGEQAFEGSSDIEELITERLVKPSIPLLERVARRQQALARTANEPNLTLYANLFDPIIVLAQERLQSGREAFRSDDLQAKQRSEELEDALTDLGLEQKAAAEEAGLPACSVDFRKALLSSLAG